jgi:hypothetical protein
VPEDRGGAVGVSGGGTTVCVGVTTAVGVLVTLAVALPLELQPVIAAAVTTAPQPIAQIIFALLIFPPGVYHLCVLPSHRCSGRRSWWQCSSAQLPGRMDPSVSRIRITIPREIP